MAIEKLLSRQNRDGGWPYVSGGSWTEPTVYAVLALEASGETEAAGRGMRWLRSAQRPDGGWPPRAEVEQSTWVTAVVALLEPEALGAERHRRAIEWLLGTTGKESSFGYRLRQWLIGNRQPPEMEFAGWPWFPDTAAWVGPTSIAVLALEKEQARRPSRLMAERIEEGRRFLLRRACPNGGWNHGAAGSDPQPYPETTGMALAALRGVKACQVDRGLEAAGRFMDECRSADAWNWLRLGLMAHERLSRGFCPPDLAFRTLPESSLDLLVARAQEGRGVLWG